MDDRASACQTQEESSPYAVFCRALPQCKGHLCREKLKRISSGPGINPNIEELRQLRLMQPPMPLTCIPVR